MRTKASSETIIDFRSDTISQPTERMRQAIANAVVGDDVFGEDPTVQELERKSAELFEKEAALFVPSGTMGNLIAIMVHCNERGAEIIVGDMSHVYLYEQGQFEGCYAIQKISNCILILLISIPQLEHRLLATLR